MQSHDGNANIAFEDAIAEIKDHYDSIIEQLPGHIYWKDINGVILGCNDIQAQSVGLSAAKDMIGLTAYDTLPREQADEITRIDQQVISTGMSVITEEVSSVAGGDMRIYLSRKTPLIHKKTNKIIGILGVSIDVTDFKRAKKKLRRTRHKLEAMTAISFSLAHELRTPLATLELTRSSLEQFFPVLVKSYEIAEEINAPIPEIPPIKLKLMENALTKMKLEIESSSNFIDMMLMKLKPSVSAKSSEIFSIAFCITKSLNGYPFLSTQRELIDLELSNDFSVQGDSLLFTHVFFNLLKNAIYYIDAVGKGRISIWLERGLNYNKVFFKDTGKGISSDILPKIFKRFFSKTYHGAGVGLTFCKMVMKSVGGDITCESVEGEYTVFVLSFPASFQTE